MDEHDAAADLIKRLGAQQSGADGSDRGGDPDGPDGPDGPDIMAQQMRARLRAKVAGKPAQRLNYAGYEDPELIGEGGMGRVYRAHDPDLDRTVAIKLVRVRQAAADLRLRHEAQTMARIDHPNVVQVFDTGRLEDGQTFLAMQFVPGHDLRAWGRQQPRSWRAVRDVYCKAGRGLEAAHRAGIVHRDFKPENVLVDAADQARVTDFGLAFAQAQDESGTAAVTGGTLAYAAPECLDGSAGDARADQFSFCVALYEALLVHPFLRPEEMSGKNPGTRTAAAASTQARGLDQTLRRRILAGEILAAPGSHKIPQRVLRALRRGLSGKPDERFPNMGQLLAVLEDEPWPRRLNLLLTGGLGLGLIASMARPTFVDTECAVDGWDSPVTEEVLTAAFVRTGVPMAAQRASNVHTALDEYAGAIADERQTLCADRRAPILAAAVLDGRARCLDDARRKLVEVAKRFESADAKLVERSLEVFAALPRPKDCQFEQAAACQLGGAGPGTFAVKAELEAAWSAELSGDYATATYLAREAVERASQTPSVGSTIVPRLYLGRLLVEQKAYDDAAVELLAVRDAAIAGDCPTQASDALEQLSKIGALSPGFNDDLVIDWSREHVAFAGNTRDPWRIAAAANSRGLVQLHRQQDLEGAEKSLSDALKQRSTATTTLQKTDHAYTLINLGSVAAARRDAATETINAQALAIFESALGPKHPIVAKPLYNMGLDAMDAENFQDARRYFDRAEEAVREGMGEGVLLADIVLAQATLAERRREFDGAIALGKEALRLADAAFGVEDPRRVDFLSGVAGLYISGGRGEEAERLLRTAIDTAPASTAPAVLASLWQSMARIELERGHHEVALAHAEKALTLYRSSAADRDDGLLPHLELSLGEALLANHRPDAAIQHLQVAFDQWTAEERWNSLGDVSWMLAKALIDRPEAKIKACEHAASAATLYGERDDPDGRVVSADIKKFRDKYCSTPDGDHP